MIGSGIAGLSTAYELALRGQKVVVLDRGRIAGGMTARTSAHLTPQCDDGFKALTDLRGVDGAKIFYESHAAAVDRIEAIQDDEAIACHFRRVNGYLFPAIGKDPAEEITPEFEATKKVGMPIERHAGLPFKGQEARALPALSEPRDLPSAALSARRRQRRSSSAAARCSPTRR